MVLATTVDGSGPERVVLLHDWLGDSRNYDAALPYLDLAALTCARVDLPGYGRSRGVPIAPLDSLGDAVLAAADALGFRRFHLVAHSMSTVVAQRLARSAPERLASVVLVAPVTPGTRYPDEVEASIRAVGADPARRRAALESMFGTRLTEAWLEWKRARWAESADPETVAAYVALFARPELPTTPADVAVPVLAVLGAHDAPWFARDAVEPALRAVHRDVVVEVCTDAGHYPMQETPPLWASLVERFVRAHPRGD